jgi:hypothetical protein
MGEGDLSSSGIWRGHRIYRCIRIDVAKPATSSSSCLQRQDRYIGLLPPGSGTPVGVESESGVRHLTSFLSPGKQVWCEGVGGRMSCGTRPELPTWAATLFRSGQVQLCEVLNLEYPDGSKVPAGCCQNWTDEPPVLHCGESNSVDGISCTSAADGITCVKTSGPGKGHGFRVRKDEAVEVGG